MAIHHQQTASPTKKSHFVDKTTKKSSVFETSLKYEKEERSQQESSLGSRGVAKGGRLPPQSFDNPFLKMLKSG